MCAPTKKSNKKVIELFFVNLYNQISRVAKSWWTFQTLKFLLDEIPSREQLFDKFVLSQDVQSENDARFKAPRYIAPRCLPPSEFFSNEAEEENDCVNSSSRSDLKMIYTNILNRLFCSYASICLLCDNTPYLYLNFVTLF